MVYVCVCVCVGVYMVAAVFPVCSEWREQLLLLTLERQKSSFFFFFCICARLSTLLYEANLFCEKFSVRKPYVSKHPSNLKSFCMSEAVRLSVYVRVFLFVFVFVCVCATIGINEHEFLLCCPKTCRFSVCARVVVIVCNWPAAEWLHVSVMKRELLLVFASC